MTRTPNDHRWTVIESAQMTLPVSDFRVELRPSRTHGHIVELVSLKLMSPNGGRFFMMVPPRLFREIMNRTRDFADYQTDYTTADFDRFARYVQGKYVRFRVRHEQVIDEDARVLSRWTGVAIRIIA